MLAQTPHPVSGRKSGKRPQLWGMGLYRIALLVALFLVLSLQKFVEVRQYLRIPNIIEVENRGPVKQFLGCCVSLLFVALLVEFATATVAQWLILRTARFRMDQPSPLDSGPSTRHRAGLFLVAGLFFLASMEGRFLSGYIAVTPSPGPVVGLMWLAAWVGFALISLRYPPRWDVALCGFAGLILISRLYAYSHLPMENISGDMLPTINRALDLLFRGEFPYTDDPPPAMPYWPVTFLLYALPKQVGWDFRASNVVVEIATVAVAFRLFSDRCLNHSDSVTARLALPAAMLFPSWTFYSAVTQYPVSVLLAVLFCRSVTCLGGRAQAVVLGIAVATNQTFGAFGLLLLPFWFRWFGPMRVLRLTATALGTCFILICPFVLWNSWEFFRVTLLSLKPFTADTMAGRFSLRPILNGLSSWATPCGLALTYAVVVSVGLKERRSRTDAAVVITLGYCFFLLFLHRSFTHYYLPVIAMVLVIPYKAHQPHERRTHEC